MSSNKLLRDEFIQAFSSVALSTGFTTEAIPEMLKAKYDFDLDAEIKKNPEKIYILTGVFKDYSKARKQAIDEYVSDNDEMPAYSYLKLDDEKIKKLLKD